MTQESKHIIALGEALIEISQNQGEFSVSVGGDTLNFAIYAKRLADQNRDTSQNHRISYATVLGDDHLTQNIRMMMTNENIDQTGILTAPKQSSGLYAIDNLPNGEKNFSYWRSQSPARSMFNQNYRKQMGDYLKTADVLYFSAISLAILHPHTLTDFFTEITALKQRKKLIIFDSNYRANLWQDHDNVADIYDQAMRLSDIILPSVEDMQLLFDYDLEDAKSHLTRYKDTLIILKNAENDVAIFNQNKWRVIPTAPLSKMIDSTAAGDSFNAGFMIGHLNNLSVDQSVSLGQKLAAKVISHKGAIIPSAAMENFMKDSL